MTSLFHYLRDSLHVTPVDGDKLEVTVTLPSDHFLHFLRILESLTGFAQILNRHARHQRIKADEELQRQKQDAEHQLARYNKRLVKLFDHYTAQGLDRNTAIKQIGADLRAERHPWSSPDLVRVGLASAGRSGTPGRPRRQP